MITLPGVIGLLCCSHLCAVPVCVSVPYLLGTDRLDGVKCIGVVWGLG